MAKSLLCHKLEKFLLSDILCEKMGSATTALYVLLREEANADMSNNMRFDPQTLKSFAVFNLYFCYLFMEKHIQPSNRHYRITITVFRRIDDDS